MKFQILAKILLFFWQDFKSFKIQRLVSHEIEFSCFNSCKLRMAFFPIYFCRKLIFGNKHWRDSVVICTRVQDNLFIHICVL